MIYYLLQSYNRCCKLKNCKLTQKDVYSYISFKHVIKRFKQTKKLEFDSHIELSVFDFKDTFTF